MILVALLVADRRRVHGTSLGRRLTPERASQNVIATGEAGTAPMQLIITANYDAGRAGLVYRPRLRRISARLRQRAGRVALGLAADGWRSRWCGSWSSPCSASAARTALRVGVAQLLPTVSSCWRWRCCSSWHSAEFGPAAGDNGSGVAAAVALARALAVAASGSRPASSSCSRGPVTAAGTACARTCGPHKREPRPANTIVLGLAACGCGAPRWWISDGQLMPAALFPRVAQAGRRGGQPRPST